MDRSGNLHPARICPIVIPEPAGYNEFVRFYATEHSKGIAIWYSDGDLCAIVEENLGLGVDALTVAKVMVDALNKADIKVDYGESGTRHQ